MNPLLSSLAETCRSHPLEEKVLIVPSYSVGHQLCEAIVLGGTNFANLRVETPFGLALSSANPPLTSDGISLLSDGAILSVVEELFRKEIHQKPGLYFGELEPRAGIISALCNAIDELRLSGIAPEHLQAPQFISNAKFAAIRLLMERFGEHLKKTRTIDKAGVYALAMAELKAGQETTCLYLVHPRLSLPELPRQFLRKLSGGRLTVLGCDPLFGVTPPRQIPFWRTDPGSTGSLYSWIARPEDVLKSSFNVNVDFFQAVGTVNEVKEVLRRIICERLPLDSVEVACVDYDAYGSLFFLEHRRQGLNITFGSGISATHTLPGKALLGFLDWIEADFSVRELRYLVTANLLERKEMGGLPPVSGQGIIRVLRKAGIGWGRDRYPRMLDRLLHEDAEKFRTSALTDEEGDRTPAWYAERSTRTRWVQAFTEGLIACVPIADDQSKVDAQQFARGLVLFLKQYCSRADELNRAGYSALMELLQELSATGAGTATLATLCEKVRMRVQELRIGASGAKPGHIHVAPYSRAGACNRPNTFVVGLAEHAFPGIHMEDPILLDEERKKISERLLLSTDRFDENLFAMYAFLAGVRGKLTLSFPSYSVEEGRELAPSPLILNAYRLVSKRPDEDFSTVRQALGEPVTYVSESPIDETEWWLSRLLTQSPSDDARKKVLGRFPHLARGLKATEARESPEFTEYDGRVRIKAALDAPRKNPELVLSASRLEVLAGCPFEYFVKYVLGLEPPDDIEYNGSVWLDAAERGSLLHAIYERFMRGVVTRGEKVGTVKHRSILLNVGELFIQAKKMEIPPPSEQVYSTERQEILASLDIFLRMEEGISATTKPRFFELQFGSGAVTEGVVGSSEPVMIDIGGESIYLRGKVDRVDELGNHEFRVLDYKTGGTYGFTSRGHFEKGKKIQHCLYARAAETVLREKVDAVARVVEGSYYFPTRKGEAEFFLKIQKSPRELNALLRDLFDVIAKGAFLPRKDPCFLCRDYNLCGTTREGVKGKMDNPANKSLDPLRRLEAYE